MEDDTDFQSTSGGKFVFDHKNDTEAAREQYTMRMGWVPSIVSPMMKRRLHHSARSMPGFSLIELVTVVIIIGILAAIALPHFANNLLSFRADAAARRITTDIATAQSRANFASQAIDITFTPGEPRYQILAMMNPDHPQAPYWVDLSTENYQANIVSADFAGEPTLRISAFGDVSQGGSIVVAVGSESRTITVDMGSGRTVVR